MMNVCSQQFKQLIIFVHFFPKHSSSPSPFLITKKLEQTYFKGSRLRIAILCSEYQGNHRVITKQIPKPKSIKIAPIGFNQLPSRLTLAKSGNVLCNLLIRNETDKNPIDSHMLLQFRQRSTLSTIKYKFFFVIWFNYLSVSLFYKLLGIKYIISNGSWNRRQMNEFSNMHAFKQGQILTYDVTF